MNFVSEQATELSELNSGSIPNKLPLHMPNQTHKNLIFLQSGYNSYLQIKLGESACSLPNRIKLRT